MIALAPAPAPVPIATVEACGASTVTLLDQILGLSRAALAAVEADEVDALLEALEARQQALEVADPCLRALLDDARPEAAQHRPDGVLARIRQLAVEVGEADGQLQRAAAAARERMAREIEELDAAAAVVLAYHRAPTRAATLDRSG
jgi:hypothetical protein